MRAYTLVEREAACHSQGNEQVTFSCVQAFSWGVHIPALEKGGDGHTVAMVGAWVVISVGVDLAVLGIVSEACLSISCISAEPHG